GGVCNPSGNRSSTRYSGLGGPRWFCLPRRTVALRRGFWGLHVREQARLQGPLASSFAGGIRSVFRLQVAGLQLRQHLPGTNEDILGNPSQAGHVNAVTLVRASGSNFVEEDDFVLPFLHEDVVVA